MITDDREQKQKTPGHIFVTCRYANERDPQPVDISIRDAETTEKAYMAEVVPGYLGRENIPDLRIACYDYDDIGALPTVDPAKLSSYLEENPSIREQNRCRPIWYRSLVESAYCIENGRDDYCEQYTGFHLAFDPKFALYRTVNDLGLRHFYRDMNSDVRAELLRRLNEDNPKLEMKELPYIGRIKRKETGESNDLEPGLNKKTDTPDTGNDNRKNPQGRSI
jgi:hypothetical protein